MPFVRRGLCASGRRSGARRAYNSTVRRGFRSFQSRPRSTGLFKNVIHGTSVGGLQRRVDRIPKAFACFNKCGFPVFMPMHVSFGEVMPAVITSGAGGTANGEQLYRLNGPYNPRYSAGGTSAQTWAVWQGIYNKYIVHSVDVELNFSFGSASTGIPVVLIQPTDGSKSLNGLSPNQAVQDNCIATYPLNKVATGDGQQIGDKFRLKLWEIEGLTYQQYMCNEASYGSLTNAVPTKTSFLRVSMCDINGSSGTNAIVEIKLTFHGRFYCRDLPLTS